jgi:hypothetical protein
MYIKHEDKIADAYLKVITEGSECKLPKVVQAELKGKVLKEEVVAATPVISNDDIMEDDDPETAAEECWCTDLKAALEAATEYSIEYNDDENILEVTDPNASSALKAEIEMVKDNTVLVTCIGMDEASGNAEDDSCEEFYMSDVDLIAEFITECFNTVLGTTAPAEDAYTGKPTDEAQTVDISKEMEEAEGKGEGKVAEAVAPKAGEAALPMDKTGAKGWLTNNDGARRTSSSVTGMQSTGKALIPNTGAKSLQEKIEKGLPIPVEEFAMLSVDDQIKYITAINYKVKPVTKAGKVFDYKSRMKPETRYWFWDDMTETGATKMKEKWEAEAAAIPKDTPTAKDFGTPVSLTEEEKKKLDFEKVKNDICDKAVKAGRPPEQANEIADYLITTYKKKNPTK